MWTEPSTVRRSPEASGAAGGRRKCSRRLLEALRCSSRARCRCDVHAAPTSAAGAAAVTHPPTPCRCSATAAVPTPSHHLTALSNPAGICAEFERRLRELNPQLRAITYDIGDLYSWVDNMPDLRCAPAVGGSSERWCCRVPVTATGWPPAGGRQAAACRAAWAAAAVDLPPSCIAPRPLPCAAPWCSSPRCRPTCRAARSGSRRRVGQAGGRQGRARLGRHASGWTAAGCAGRRCLRRTARSRRPRPPAPTAAFTHLRRLAEQGGR